MFWVRDVLYFVLYFEVSHFPRSDRRLSSRGKGRVKRPTSWLWYQTKITTAVQLCFALRLGKKKKNLKQPWVISITWYNASNLWYFSQCAARRLARFVVHFGGPSEESWTFANRPEVCVAEHMSTCLTTTIRTRRVKPRCFLTIIRADESLWD